MCWTFGRIRCRIHVSVERLKGGNDMATESIFAPVVIRGRKAQRRLLSAMDESERRVKAMKPSTIELYQPTEEELTRWFGKKGDGE